MQRVTRRSAVESLELLQSALDQAIRERNEAQQALRCASEALAALRCASEPHLPVLASGDAAAANERDKALEERNHAFAARDTAIAERDYALACKMASEQALNNVTEAMRVTIGERDQAVSACRDAVCERDQALAHKEQSDKAAAETEAALAERTRELVLAKDTAVASASSLAECETKLTQTEALVAELLAITKTLDSSSRVQELEAALIRERLMTSRAEKKAQEKDEELAAMQSKTRMEHHERVLESQRLADLVRERDVQLGNVLANHQLATEQLRNELAACSARLQTAEESLREYATSLLTRETRIESLSSELAYLQNELQIERMRAESLSDELACAKQAANSVEALRKHSDYITLKMEFQEQAKHLSAAEERYQMEAETVNDYIHALRHALKGMSTSLSCLVLATACGAVRTAFDKLGSPPQAKAIVNELMTNLHRNVCTLAEHGSGAVVETIYATIEDTPASLLSIPGDKRLCGRDDNSTLKVAQSVAAILRYALLMVCEIRASTTVIPQLATLVSI
jgi:hypothetical protein